MAMASEGQPWPLKCSLRCNAQIYAWGRGVWVPLCQGPACRPTAFLAVASRAARRLGS